ncbi:MAG: MFS transporter [Rickettsiaceae bacterium]|nr:MFS transporter [Rickettsiaceae bacterium]
MRIFLHRNPLHGVSFLSFFTVISQYYNYHLFGFLAAYISHVFFPANNEISQLLNTYLVMTLTIIAKPIGAVLLGNWGDKIGRKTSFKLSLISTACASFLICIAPSYKDIGILSIIILIISRLLICLFVSAGTDGVRLYVYENINKDAKCLGTAITTVFAQLGSLLASISAWFFTLNFFPNYFWRISFFIGFLIVSLNYFLLTKDQYTQNKMIKDDPETIIKILFSNRLLFIAAVCLAGSIGASNQFLVIFFSTYIFQILDLVDNSIMYQYVSIFLVLYMFSSVACGILADKYGYIIIFNIGAILSLFLSCVICYSISNSYLSYYAYLGLAITLPKMIIPCLVIFKQSIPFTIRYRLFSLSHAIGSIIISAPTPYISTFLYYKTNITWLPVLYLITILIMIILITHYLYKTRL